LPTQNPEAPEELTKQIEQLVEQYVAQSHCAAREALERAFGSAAPATKANCGFRSIVNAKIGAS
jgi:hypothetical protein